MSRNFGIAFASGDLVAFIDDDGLAEPEWLSQLAPAFADPMVGAAGGIVYDHTCAAVQYTYSTADRFGRPNFEHSGPADRFNFPYPFSFLYVQGTNCEIRRSALLEIGGFDEEYEFYLDETDVCCRLVDTGYTIRQLSDAFVHHKFLPSETRNEHRVTQHRYAVLKNKLYFSFVNNHHHFGVGQAIADAVAFVEEHERDVRFHIEHGRLEESDLLSFREDVQRSWEVGLHNAMNGRRRLISGNTIERFAGAFRPFETRVPVGGRCTFCFISQEYPPGPVGGVGRYTHEMAQAVAELGHHVHVLAIGKEHDRVDFENGVWVRRLLPDTPKELGKGVPEKYLSHARTMANAIDNISVKRPVTAVCAPLWDCEGIAVSRLRQHPLIVSLHTTMRHWLDSFPRMAHDKSFMQEIALPIIAAEEELLSDAQGILANSHAIVSGIEEKYGIELKSQRVQLIPHGLEDWTKRSADARRATGPRPLRLLFVGRLEPRKGIDILLKAAPRVLSRHENVHLDIVGRDEGHSSHGQSFRTSFENHVDSREFRDRIVFHGEVDQDTLLAFYRDADLLVALSRYESFGLMLVEGMMFGMPVIGCRAGGMEEVVLHGDTGLLAEPGDAASLESCLDELITNSELRTKMGVAGRARYLGKFTRTRMAAEFVEFARRLALVNEVGDYAGTTASSLRDVA